MYLVSNLVVLGVDYQGNPYQSQPTATAKKHHGAHPPRGGVRYNNSTATA